MPSSLSAGTRLRRLIALLGALVLLPLAVVLAAAPAQAAPAALTGSVTDGLGDQLAGVEVQAVYAATLDAVPGAGAKDTTDGTGAYSLDLATGTYKIRYSKDGYTPDWYGGGDAPVITVDGDGVATAEDDSIEDGELGPVSLNRVATHTISGTVVKPGGGALSGVVVDVYASDDHDDVLKSASTQAGGAFSVALAEGVYHVRLSDPSHTYLPRWYGADNTPEDVVLSTDRALGPIELAPVPVGAEFPIAGRVIDANGDHVDGVNVAVAVAVGTGDSGSGTTAGDGSYSVTVLPGTYRVTFSGTGFATREYGVEGGSSLVTVAADGQLSTAPAEALADNRLGDFTLASTAYAKTGSVHAAVGGAPVEGITIRAFPDDSRELADVVDTTTTGADGAYTLQLPIGSYHVQVVDLDAAAPDYQPTWIGGETPAEVKVAQAGTLTVGGSPATSLGEVQLSVATTTTTYAVSGNVVDANGDPLPATTVTAAPQPGTASENSASATTDALGHYVLAVKAGSYQITYAATDFKPATYSGAGSAPLDVTVSGTGTVTAGAVEAPGGALQDVELAGTATYAVTGTIQDATNNQPITGIHVTARSIDDPSIAAATATTNGVGGYTISGLTVGTYTLDFADTDGAGEQYVTTSYGGSPAAEVKVARGGGAIVANATMPGNDLGTTKLAQATSNTTYPVSGDLTDANGDPIVAATVTALTQGTTPGGNQVVKTTDSNGHYVLDLKVGSYRIKYEATAFATAQYSNDAEPPAIVDVVVASGGTVTAGTTAVPSGVLEDVVLLGTTSHTISGLVTNTAAAPISGLVVKLYNADDNSLTVADASTNGAGGYSFSGLRIGTYLIEVVGTSQYVGAWYLNSQTSTTATEIKIGQGSTIYSGGSPTAPNGTLSTMSVATVTADTTYVVSGDVTDVNGDGIAGRSVTADTAGTANDATVVSGPEGEFVFKLKAGTYVFDATGNADFENGFFTSDDEVRQPVVVAATGVTVDGETMTDGAIGSITLAGKKAYPVTGTATNGSAGLPGITVEAFASGSSSRAALTTTAAGGAFGVSLKIGTYTLRFTDNTSNATRYRQTYFGGEPAKEVQVGQGGFLTVDGAAVPLVTVMTAVTADTTYDLKGTVYEPVDYDALNGVTVTAVPVTGTPGANQRQATTGPDAALGEGGVYRIPVKSGKYQLKFEKAGYQPGFLMNEEGDVPVPAIVTVGATGAISAPGLELTDGIIDDYQMLFPASTFKTAPTLSGKVAVAQTVTTTFGALQGAGIDNDYVTVEWFLDGKAADDYSTGAFYQKYQIPAAAAGKKLTYRVTIDDPDGMRAMSVFDSKPVLVQKAATKLKATFKKGKLSVALALVKATAPKGALPPLTGKILVKKGKKTVATIKLKAKSKGKGAALLTKLKPGKYKLTVVYAGSKSVAPAKAAIKVKITKQKPKKPKKK